MTLRSGGGVEDASRRLFEEFVLQNGEAVLLRYCKCYIAGIRVSWVILVTHSVRSIKAQISIISSRCRRCDPG